MIGVTRGVTRGAGFALTLNPPLPPPQAMANIVLRVYGEKADKTAAVSDAAAAVAAGSAAVAAYTAGRRGGAPGAAGAGGRGRWFAEEEGAWSLPEQRPYRALHYFDRGTAPARPLAAPAARR